MELLKEVLPRLSRVGVLWDGNGAGPAVAFKEYEAAARAFKLDYALLKCAALTLISWSISSAKRLVWMR